MSEEIKEILDYISSDRTVDAILLPDYFKELEDYITNLQEENERIKEVNKIFSERIISENNPDYKSRCEKAIEYINNHKEPLHHYFDEPDCNYWIATNPANLLNILNGGDKE